MNGQKSGAAMVATVAMAPSSLDTLDTIHSINDPKWRVTENLRDYWAQQGPTRCIPELGWEVCCFLMHPLFLGWSITWSDNHYSNNEASTCKLLFDTLPYLLCWRWRRSSTCLLITHVCWSTIHHWDNCDTFLDTNVAHADTVPYTHADTAPYSHLFHFLDCSCLFARCLECPHQRGFLDSLEGQGVNSGQLYQVN